MSENYFKILEMGKNVGKSIFKRSVKMSGNYLAKVQTDIFTPTFRHFFTPETKKI